MNCVKWSGYNSNKINMKINKANKVVIHHSASGVKTTTKQISKWHKDRSFYYNEAFDNWVGYHYIIHASGRIEQTKLLRDEGCHCIGQNTQSVGVCLIGNFENTYPTDSQASSLMSLIDYLNRIYGKKLPVWGHCKYSATLCPGDHLKGFVKLLNDKSIMKLIYK